MNQKYDRVKAIIDRNIRDIILFKVKLDKIGFVSVNEVEVSNDHSYAKIYVSFLGNKYPHQAFEELKKQTGFVRHELSKKLSTYKTPEVIFIYDDSFEKAEHLDEILKKDEELIKNRKKIS